jgi:type VI secretion system protein VasG
VVNLFYQVFDKGTLSDGEGRIIDFKNTILFLTSNLASDAITRLCAEEKRPSAEALVEAIRPTLSKHFKPALLARMTIVPYFTLDPSFMQQIVTLKLDRLVARMAENNRMRLNYSAEVVEQIAARCTEVETGARNIDHIMRGTILPQLSREILARLGDESMPTEVNLEIKEGAFSIRFAG